MVTTTAKKKYPRNLARGPQSQPSAKAAGPNGRSLRGTRDRLLTEAEVAEWLGISPLTLRKWRCLRTQPLPFLKIKKVIRYRESDMLPFIESHMVVPRSV